MAEVRTGSTLGAAVWSHVAVSPEDMTEIKLAVALIEAGNMTLAEAQAHELSHVLVEE